MATRAQEQAVVSQAAIGHWVDRSAAATASLTASSTSAASTSWGSFTSWYDVAAVATQAAAAAELSRAAQEAAAGLFTEYVAQVVALMSGDRIDIPKIRPPLVRNGTDPVAVYTRPAQVFRVAFSETADELLAIQRAQERSRQLIEADIMLAARQAQQEAMEEFQIRQYRRVLRPELSESGPCGLCVVAADRIYDTKDLMPIHGRCRCITLPIYGEFDPGVDINRADLKRIYSAAGDTTEGRELKKVRVQVNEHGELGPVLTVRGQKFTGPDDLAQRRDPEQNRRDLNNLISVLDQLTTRQAEGEDLDAPLAYQRNRIARLERAA